jgi:hypothetical protein
VGGGEKRKRKKNRGYTINRRRRKIGKKGILGVMKKKN